MSDEQKYAGSLQENLITLLAFDEAAGKHVASLISTNLMDGEYRLLAERFIDYRRKYGTAPGDHTADCVEDVLDDPKNKRAKSMKRTLENMYALRDRVNTRYVIDQVETLHKMQRMRAAIVESAEKISNQQHMALADIESIWHDLLKVQKSNFTPGLSLRQHQHVMDRVQTISNEFTTGIKELDENGVVPARGMVYMFLAAAGRGKTWFAMQCARRAIDSRKKVLHISLEMDEELVAMRYFQTMFDAAKRPGAVYTTTMEKKNHELIRLNREIISPRFHLSQSNVDLELETMIGRMGRRADYLRIKRFPGKYLTGAILRGYLDMLEQTEGFIPDLLIVDYPRLMKMDSRQDLRIGIDDTIIDLRALAVERNVAVIAPHQASKEGEQATQIKNTHMSEAWALAGTVDMLVTYSCSDLEFNYGLGRLFVAKSRYERDRYTTLITQNYNLGKFAVASYPMAGLDYQPMFTDFTKEFRNEAFTPTHVAEDVDD